MTRSFISLSFSISDHTESRPASAPYHNPCLRIVGLRHSVAMRLAAISLADRVVARPDSAEGGVPQCPGAGHVGCGVARVHHRGGMRQFDGRGCVEWWVLARVGRGATRASCPVVSSAPLPDDSSHPHPGSHQGGRGRPLAWISQPYPSLFLAARLQSDETLSDLARFMGDHDLEWACENWSRLRRLLCGRD